MADRAHNNNTVLMFENNVSLGSGKVTNLMDIRTGYRVNFNENYANYFRKLLGGMNKPAKMHRYRFVWYNNCKKRFRCKV